LFNGNNFAT